MKQNSMLPRRRAVRAFILFGLLGALVLPWRVFAASLPYCVAVEEAPPITLSGFPDPTYETKLNTSTDKSWREWRESLYSLYKDATRAALTPWFQSVTFVPKGAASTGCPLRLDTVIAYQNLKGSLLSPFGRKVTYTVRSPEGSIVWQKTVDAGEMKPSIMKSTMAERTKEGLEIASRKFLSFFSSEAAEALANLVPGGGAEGKAAVASLQRGVQALIQKVSADVPPYFRGRAVAVNPAALASLAAPAAKTPSASPSPGRYAVLVGIGTYADGSVAPSAERDVERMRAALVQKAGVPEKNIQVLLGAKATLKGWKQLVEKRLSKRAGKAETVFFYFAGRASFDGETTSFVPYDGNEGQSGSLYALEDLSRALESATAGRVVLLHESRLPAGAVSPDGRLRELGLSDEAHFLTKRTVYFGSASASGTEFGGLFTYAVADGMRGAADINEDGTITPRELYFYADDVMRATAQAHPAAFPDAPAPSLYPEEGDGAEFSVIRLK